MKKTVFAKKLFCSIALCALLVFALSACRITIPGPTPNPEPDRCPYTKPEDPDSDLEFCPESCTAQNQYRTGWDGRRAVYKNPYVQRHGGKAEDGVFWEVPVVRAGESPRPGIDINREPLCWRRENSEHDWRSPLSVIDSYQALSQMRLGQPNWSRPIKHGYTQEFFKEYALLFAHVMTSSGGFVPFVRFETLVTCGHSLHPVFSLNLPENSGDYGWTDDIGEIMFMLEIPRALLEYYSLGNIGWINNDSVAVWMGWHSHEGQINRLTDVQKVNCDCLFGLHHGEDDAVWTEYNYILEVEGESFRFIGNNGNSSHRVYVRRQGDEDFIFGTWVIVFRDANHNNWHRRLLDLPLLPGENTLRIVSGSTTFVNGADERTYSYATLFMAAEVRSLNYEFSVDGSAGGQSISWQSAGLYRVYYRRAGTDIYRLTSLGGFSVAGNLGPDWATRSIGLRNFDFQIGVNTVKVVNYTYHSRGGFVTRNEARWDIERAADTAVDYDFRVGNAFVIVQSIMWNGTGTYYPFIRRAGTNEFVSVYWWGIRGESGAALSGLNFNQGYNEFKVTQMYFSGDTLSLRVGLFPFYYKTVDISDEVNFEIEKVEVTNQWTNRVERRLTWDRSSAWEFAHVFLGRANENEFRFADIARNGQGENFGVGFNLARLRANDDTVRVTFDWTYNEGVITRYSAYWQTALLA